MSQHRARKPAKKRDCFQRRLKVESLESRLLLHGGVMVAAGQSYGDLPLGHLLVSAGSAAPSISHHNDAPELDFNDLVVGTTGAGSGSTGFTGATSPLSSVPVLNSLPGAAASLWLDFVGHYDASWGAYSNITTPVFDQDGDPTTFSDGELATIQAIWAQVSEDYAPFKINVTTVQPSSFANGVAECIAIGGTGAWTGGTYGGVSYIGSFTNYIANTSFVFSSNLGGGNAKYTAEAIAHEAGHAFGLQHQKQYDASGNLVNEYYPGPGDGTAPVMGNSYYAPLTRWWYGTSLSSTTYQDDMAVIASATNGFGYRADDHGNTTSTATPLSISLDQLSGSGIIGTPTDVDYFSFSTDAGQISLSVDVPSGINDLVPQLELRDATGVVIASASQTNGYDATITATVGAGNYYLDVASTGGYGNVGQYTIGGTVIPLTNIVNAPSNLTATAGSGQVALSWIDNATNDTFYEITRSTDGVNWTTVATPTTGSTTYTDTTVSAGMTYSYRVRAGNDTLMSNYSNTAQATLAPLAPQAPTGLTAAAVSSSQINLSWTGVGGATSYKVLRSTDGGGTWTQVATVGANVTSYQNTGLASATTYSYCVVASNAGGDSSPSNLASATTSVNTTVPKAPSNLTAVAASGTQVNLLWHDNSTNESGFKIERSSNGGKTWTQIAVTAANITSFADTSVSSQSSYNYRVRAFNDAGNSGYSNSAGVKTPALPVNAPTNLAAVAMSTTQINVTWQDNSNNETGFRIERSTNGGASWSQIATVGANVTSFTNTNLTRGQTYSYRVRAYGLIGNSAYTNVAFATVPLAAKAMQSA
jgi:fibronectin type 3 domain-containing protein